MATDLFGESVQETEVRKVRVFADEIQSVTNPVTGEEWIYMGAIYELTSNPIVDGLVFHRYRKDHENWKEFKEKNDSVVHWHDLRDTQKKLIAKRWLDYILDDCRDGERKFHFSLSGINLSNLVLCEFGDEQRFNAIYNRFFRSMLKYSLKTFFGRGVVVTGIYHEEGQQASHSYFDWHTILKLEQDEFLNFECDRVKFLPKSHKEDKNSNIIQLCDVLLGIFKDLHLGVNHDSYSQNKREVIDTRFVQELLVDRVIREPRNFNSKYGHARRFHISLFPREKSDPESTARKKDNYYDIPSLELGYYRDSSQLVLFE